MKHVTHTLPWFLLALSVLFNVFFTAGYFKARAESGNATSADAVSNRIAGELELTDEQRAVLDRLRRSTEEESAAVNEARVLIEEELADAISRGDSDEAIKEILDRKRDLHRQGRAIRERRFREFLEVLTPEQRERMSRRMRGHGPPGRDGRGPANGRGRRGRGGDGWRDRMLERFDENGDGDLDEAERAKAEAHRAERDRLQEEHRHEASRRQFDANGDGVLDADEEAAWQERERERKQDRLERFDRNGNGVIDPEEHLRGGRGARGRDGPPGG